jgi:hypothetical protein
VWQPRKRKTGEPKKFWWHLAAGIKFHQVADLQWVLTLRPERHVTKDSIEPLASKEVGPKVTSLKARMYNELYLREVHFWRDYLAQGNPRTIMDFGTQSAIIGSQLIGFGVRSPGIPGDNKALTAQLYPEDLFSLIDLGQAETGEDVDWDEFEDESEEDEFQDYDED